MRTSLNTLIRYRTIDHCLKRKGMRWTWKELATECGEALRYYIDTNIDDPSRRTIMYDLKRMKNGMLGYEAPISMFDRKAGTYYYSNPDFSLTTSPVTNEDLEELNHALVILKQFSGFNHMRGVERIITKLEDTIQSKGKKPKDIIHFDHSVNAPGQEFLDTLYRVIFDKTNIELKYLPFDFIDTMEVVLSPYLLKEYNKRWYLIGWNHEANMVHHFALDRILKLEVSRTRFYQLKSFRAEQYFKDIIGVTLPEGGKMEEVVFEAEEMQAKYILTKPIHPTQKVIKEKKGKVTFSIQVIVNYELESLLLSFGEKVKVLKPVKLKKVIKQRIMKAMEQY